MRSNRSSHESHNGKHRQDRRGQWNSSADMGLQERKWNAVSAAKRGRPKSDENLDLVSLEACIQRAQEFLKSEQPPFTKRTLQNKISKGEYERYGTYHHPMVDWNEVKKTLHWRRRIS